MGNDVKNEEVNREEIKKEIGLFRFSVIADLIGRRKLSRGERKRILKDKSATEWEIPYLGRSYISCSTILYWLRCCERNRRRLESLYPL